MKMGIGDQGASAGKNKRRVEEGYALMLTMFMVAVSLTVLIATMSRLSGDADLNARNGQYNASLYAAEAAVERVVARMRYDYIIGGGSAAVSNNLDLYRSYYPGKLGATEDPSGYWSNFQFSDGQGYGNATYVSCISNATWGPLQSQYAGLNGWTQIYRVLSNAKQINGRFDLTNAVQEDIQLIQIPIFQFGLFYNGLMEFTWCATFTVNGRTHANGNIFVGSASALTFSSTVTTTGGIYKTNWDGHTLGQMTASVSYNGNPGYSTNVNALSLPIGQGNTPAAIREVLNVPPTGEDPTSPMGLQRYYNQPGVELFVSNLTVTAYVKTSGTDAPVSLTVTNWGTNSASLALNFPFLSMTNFFTDWRELSKTVRATQIDVGAYSTWLTTSSLVLNKFGIGSTVYPGVLYVMDNRTSATNTDLFAVRLMNGSIIPMNGPPTQPGGWTVATPNPLYVWGHYNIGPGGSTNAGTTDTSKTYPASLVSDALTILSGNWVDAQSSLPLRSTTPPKAAAQSTTVNAAILTGIVYSTDATSNHFSGGVMNLPRLLEDWQGYTLTLNTSIVNLFDSVMATNWFRNPGTYYFAPTRSFSFDNNFTNQVKLPPATPVLGLISRARWRVPPPNNVTYAGN
jgi:hypothetical protein